MGKIINGSWSEILQGKTSVSEASRAHDFPPSDIEE